jgi:hypothetical protein
MSSVKVDVGVSRSCDLERRVVVSLGEPILGVSLNECNFFTDTLSGGVLSRVVGYFISLVTLTTYKVVLSLRPDVHACNVGASVHSAAAFLCVNTHSDAKYQDCRLRQYVPTD